MVCLRPFLTYAQFELMFTRKCPSCAELTSFSQHKTSLNVPSRWRYMAHPRYVDSAQSMSTIIKDVLLDIQPEPTVDARTCPSCKATVKWIHPRTITERQIVSTSPQFFIDVTAASRCRNLKLIQPTVECKLCIGEHEFFLFLLIFWPGDGHFSCVQYLFDDHTPVWYWYDGLQDRGGESCQRNAIFLGTSLDDVTLPPFAELVGLWYCREETPESNIQFWVLLGTTAYQRTAFVVFATM